MNVTLVGGFGGRDDLDFLAPMLGRRHEVTTLDPRDRLRTDADTVLIGYSLGAVAAAAHAATHDIAALVLICPWAEPTPALTDWAAHAADADFAAHTMLSPAAFGRTPIVQSALLELAGGTRVADAALGIRCPALVIAATGDTVAPAAQSRLLFGTIPDARLAEIASGHAALVERPAEVHALIDAFLRDPAAGRGRVVTRDRV